MSICKSSHRTALKHSMRLDCVWDSGAVSLYIDQFMLFREGEYPLFTVHLFFFAVSYSVFTWLPLFAHSLSHKRPLRFHLLPAMNADSPHPGEITLHRLINLDNRQPVPGKPSTFIFDAIFPSDAETCDCIGSFRYYASAQKDKKVDDVYEIRAKVRAQKPTPQQSCSLCAFQ